MMKCGTIYKIFVLAMIILSGFTESVFAASVELWPAERRQNQTLFCYGGDWNVLSIILFSDKGVGSMKTGKYAFTPPESFTDQTVLEVTLPKSVKFLGGARGDVCVSRGKSRYRHLRFATDASPCFCRFAGGLARDATTGEQRAGRVDTPSYADRPTFGNGQLFE